MNLKLVLFLNLVLGKMLTHPLNLRGVAMTPLELYNSVKLIHQLVYRYFLNKKKNGMPLIYKRIRVYNTNINPKPIWKEERDTTEAEPPAVTASLLWQRVYLSCYWSLPHTLLFCLLQLSQQTQIFQNHYKQKPNNPIKENITKPKSKAK